MENNPHQDQTWASILAYNFIQKQIRTVNCAGPKKPRNLLQALAYRQLYPNQSFYCDHHLRDSQSSISANRIQDSSYAQARVPNFENTFGRTVMFQLEGLHSDTIAMIRPFPDQTMLLMKPRVALSNQDRSASSHAESDFDIVQLANSFFVKQDQSQEHIFIHKNAFGNIKFQNYPEDNYSNIAVFMSHFSGLLLERDNQLQLNWTIYCEPDSVNIDPAVQNVLPHTRENYFEDHSLTDEPYLGPNRPFEDYYTEIEYGPSDTNEDEQINGPEMVPLMEHLPIPGYLAIHWDLIRMFYCENVQTTTSPVLPLCDVSLNTFDIRYREPGYHRCPIPCESICGYSNGNIRLGIYDRRCTPMRHEINIHDESIMEVKFHPKNDFQFLVSGDDDFLRLYDVRMFPFDGSGVPEPVIDFQEHQSGSRHLHIILDPTTNLLVSPGYDNMVRFWNLSTGKLERCFDPQYDILPEAYSPFHAFYSGDFRYNDCSHQSEVLFTMYNGDYRVFASKIYNSPDTE